MGGNKFHLYGPRKNYVWRENRGYKLGCGLGQ